MWLVVPVFVVAFFLEEFLPFDIAPAAGRDFGAYHLHVPWVIPIALIDTFVLSLPSRRYQSALIGIIAHSAQSLFLFALVLMLFLTP